MGKHQLNYTFKCRKCKNYTFKLRKFWEGVEPKMSYMANVHIKNNGRHSASAQVLIRNGFCFSISSNTLAQLMAFS